MRLPVPAEVRSGRYTVEVTIAADVAGAGVVEGAGQVERVVIDHTAPQSTLVPMSPAVLPVRDGYEDKIEVRVRDQEADVKRLDLWGREGNRRKGALLPAGDYTLRLTTEDHSGNVGVTEAPMSIDHRRLVKRTWQRTVTAKKSLTGSDVGTCSQLARTVRRRASGTLGFYSRTRCDRPKDSAVVGLHRLSVPVSDTGRYGPVRLSLRGGAAKGAGFAYFKTWFPSPYDGITGETQHDARWGTHRARKPEVPVVWRPSASKTIVYWYGGLSEGARYDVSSYTLSIEVWDLR